VRLCCFWIDKWGKVNGLRNTVFIGRRSLNFELSHVVVRYHHTVPTFKIIDPLGATYLPTGIRAAPLAVFTVENGTYQSHGP
jgi:hypothetical protein